MDLIFVVVQPVIQRETVQPTVVHQTVGIHEKIHDAPIVHEATTLPTINAAEFLSQKKAGGPLSHTDKGLVCVFFGLKSVKSLYHSLMPDS